MHPRPFLAAYNRMMEQIRENPYSPPQEPIDHDSGKLGRWRPSRWKLGRQFAGWGLLAIGLAGLVLPILPGWIFIAWGCVTLAPDVPFFDRLLDRVARRVPQLRSAIARVRGASEN